MDRDYELSQHIGWLKMFTAEMNENNWRDMKLRIERQLSALSPSHGDGGGWKPIETAPKDGTAVWVWYDGRAYLAQCESADPPLRPTDCWFLKASFKRKANRFGDDIYGCYAHDVKPVYWQPLPPPPSPSSQGTETK